MSDFELGIVAGFGIAVFVYAVLTALFPPEDRK